MLSSFLNYILGISETYLFTPTYLELQSLLMIVLTHVMENKSFKKVPNSN